MKDNENFGKFPADLWSDALKLYIELLKFKNGAGNKKNEELLKNFKSLKPPYKNCYPSFFPKISREQGQSWANVLPENGYQRHQFFFAINKETWEKTSPLDQYNDVYHFFQKSSLIMELVEIVQNDEQWCIMRFWNDLKMK